MVESVLFPESVHLAGPLFTLPARAVFQALGRMFRGLRAVPVSLTGAVSVPPIHAGSAMMSSWRRYRNKRQPAECQQQKIIVSVGPDEGQPHLPQPTTSSSKGDAQVLHVHDVLDDSHTDHPAACLPVSPSGGPHAPHHPSMRERTRAFVSETRHVIRETPEAAAEAAGEGRYPQPSRASCQGSPNVCFPRTPKALLTHIILH